LFEKTAFIKRLGLIVGILKGMQVDGQVVTRSLRTRLAGLGASFRTLQGHEKVKKNWRLNRLNGYVNGGGVLEHPAASRLWPTLNLPKPGNVDEYGGFSICIDQFWFGHKAAKKTLLYICGCKERDLPPIPLRFDAITYVVSSCKRNKAGRRGVGKKEITKSEREHTPIELAKWLIQVTEKCKTIPEQLKTI
jgi:hypothetical protein